MRSSLNELSCMSVSILKIRHTEPYVIKSIVAVQPLCFWVYLYKDIIFLKHDCHIKTNNKCRISFYISLTVMPNLLKLFSPVNSLCLFM